MRAGYTKKPCHGCGEVDTYGRPADKVCGTCRKLLDEARAAREAAGRDKSTAVYRIPDRPYDIAGGYYVGDRGRGVDAAREAWQKAILDLIHLLGEPCHQHQYSAGVECLLRGDACREGGGRAVKRYRKDVAAALERVEAAAAAAVGAYFEDGRESGHDLIGELAAGRLSVAALNEQTAGRKLQRQKKDKR